jgi:arsenical pump membrane protein
VPETPSLVGLLAVAGVAAVLANLVNNLPATLLLLAALGPGPAPAIVLAVLLGVNIGPNPTYVGSLATLLWWQALGVRAAPAGWASSPCSACSRCRSRSSQRPPPCGR